MWITDGLRTCCAGPQILEATDNLIKIYIIFFTNLEVYIYMRPD